MKLEEVNSVFILAGLPVLSVVKIRNQYWPDHPNYDEVRNANPWWEVCTSEGMIRIGWRKRVIEIDWSATHRRGTITTDDVTKEDYMVHAYDIGTAISYLRQLRALALHDIVDVNIKSYLITNQNDIDLTCNIVMEDNLTEGQKELITMVLRQARKQHDTLTLRVTDNRGYKTVQIKSPTIYLEIKP